MDWVEEVRGLSQILKGKLEEQRLARFALNRLPADGIVVEVPLPDGFIEDRRVGGQARY